MDAAEKIARLLFSFEDPVTPWDEIPPLGQRTYRDDAARLIVAFPQLALEGRKEWGDALNARYPTTEAEREFATHKRTVWESPWSEVRS